MSLIRRGDFLVLLAFVLIWFGFYYAIIRPLLPSPIMPNVGIPLVQSIISVDGVLFGFFGIIVGLLATQKKKLTIVWISPLMGSFILLVISIFLAFYGLATGTSGISTDVTFQSIGFMIFGTFYFLYFLTATIGRLGE